MLAAIFAIITVIGTWFAWRRNPMYSTRRTLYFVLAFAVSITAAICLFIAAFKLTEHSSQTVQLTAIFSTVFVVTIGMIWAIIAATTPKTAAIPDGVPMATLHRRRILPWLKRYLWTLAILGLIALIPAHAGSFNWPRFFALFIGAWVLGLGTIMLIVGYIAGRNLDHALTAVEANAWVHWTYTPEEWAWWTSVLVARADAEARKPSAMTPGKSTLFALFLFAVIAISIPEAIWVRIVAGLAINVFVFGLLYLADGTRKNSGSRLAKKLSAALPEAYFAADGVYVNGEYNAWTNVSQFLLEASSELIAESPNQLRPSSAPRSLKFYFEKVQPGGYSGPVTTHFTLAVLVPTTLSAATVSQQLAALQTNLDTTSKTGRVHLL